MRLRNIPAAAGAIENSEFCINDPLAHKGLWHDLFSNSNPIHIEIGMGKGRFLCDLARENPNINYIGVERYQSVLYRAVQKMDADPIENVLFICVDAATLPEIFEMGEVDRIYLNFSDPWPKDRHARRRLTSREFLHRYSQILSETGRIEFKTDNKDLFDFSLEEVKESEYFKTDAFTYDLHNDESMNVGNIMTEYEEKFSSKGNPICKMIISRQ
ncbi:MAG: tRNA (guanosine(46)-N7)-methyltransferase TrmB [Lachnospiraceae bacterium]|nr:tRNA (guanosine(46)-N7)-methyltransferase TrmB [Lachnospiraceae bacterium]